MNEHERALAEYVVELVKEEHGADEVHIEPGVEWNLNDLTIESLDYDTVDGEPMYHILMVGQGVESILERKAKLNPPGSAHPAEYRTEYPPIRVDITFRPKQAFSKDEVHVVVKQD